MLPLSERRPEDSKKKNSNKVFNTQGTQRSECEVVVYYWGSIATRCCEPISIIFTTLIRLLTCPLRMIPYFNKLLELQSSRLNDFLQCCFGSLTDHVSIEIRYDFYDQDYQRRFYVSLYPDGKKCASECIPQEALSYNRSNELTHNPEKLPNAQVVIQGLNFKKMSNEINKLFGAHQLDKKRCKIYNKNEREWEYKKDIENGIAEEKDPIRVGTLKDVNWSLIHCYGSKNHSCATLVNMILMSGGLQVDKTARIFRAGGSIITILLLLIISLIPTIIDYGTNGEINHTLFDIVIFSIIGVFFTTVIYTQGLGFDDCCCYENSPFIRPRTVFWKAKNASGIGIFREISTERKQNDYYYNSPFSSSITSPTVDPNYNYHICYPNKG